jgi:diguanylate cyclase (GGDEF)-like protein/PAS domain S-box-containing protein
MGQAVGAVARRNSEGQREVMGDSSRGVLGPEDYRALYENSSNAILCTVGDGRVLAANPAACTIFRLTEAEICALGRQGLADPSDDRWRSLLVERQRTGSVHGVARMIRGDGALIEAEISANIFTAVNGEERAWTVLRDVTGRVAMERRLEEITAQLRDLALNDELTGLRNRRGFVEVSSQVLEMADRQQVSSHLLFLDVDNLKELNDRLGHKTGDAGLKAVARALTHALRRADVVSRLGGDEFVALTLGLDGVGQDAVEARIRQYLGAAPTVGSVGASVEVSLGWAERTPGQLVTVDDLLEGADHVMYRAKANKRERGHGPTTEKIELDDPSNSHA